MRQKSDLPTMDADECGVRDPVSLAFHSHVSTSELLDHRLVQKQVESPPDRGPEIHDVRRVETLQGRHNYWFTFLEGVRTHYCIRNHVILHQPKMLTTYSVQFLFVVLVSSISIASSISRMLKESAYLPDEFIS
jgi:hypothetical protein